MGSEASVTSVLRVLTLLCELNRQRVSSIQDLHNSTGLPKSTLVRLLKTLCDAGYVSNNRARGGYQVTSLVKSLSCGFHRDPLIVEAGRPWAIDFTRRYRWPVAIAVLNVDAVRICFTTNPDSPVSPFHGTINSRMCLLTRALGRAHLAFCPEEERDLILNILRSSNHPEDQGVHDIKATLAMLASIKRAGFALRDANVEPTSSGTVAVPVMYGNKVLATVAMSYFKSAISPQEIISRYVPLLRDLGRNIENSAVILKNELTDISLI